MRNIEYAVICEESKLAVFVVSVGVIQNENVFEIDSNNKYNMVFMCTKGKGSFFYRNKEYHFKAPCACVIAANEQFKLVKESDECELFLISFGGTEASYIVDNVVAKRSPLVYVTNEQIIKQYLFEISFLINEELSYNGFVLSAKIYDLLIEIARQDRLAVIKNKSIKVNQLNPVIEFMKNHISADITLEKISEVAKLSPQYICRLFKECLDMRPFEYFAKLRINKAKKLLVESSYQINRIGELVGYNDCSYFCSVFKKMENISPNEFRDLYT